jgi:PAS domain S-box-containing protein
MTALSMKRRPWSLAVMLTVRFSVVAIIPVVAIGLVFLVHFAPQVHKDIEERQKSVATAVVVQVEAYFSVATRELGALSRLLKAGLRDGKELDAMLDAHAGTSDFYEAIYLTDRNGRVISIGLPLAAQSGRDNFVGLDLSRRDFMRDAHQRGQPVWSNSFLSPVSGRLAIAVAVPMGEQTLVGEVAVSPMPALAMRLTENTPLSVMMLDRQDQLVAHSANAYADQQLNLGHLPIVRLARQTGDHHLSDFLFNGVQLVGEARPVNGPDWLVIVAQPHAIAYAPIDSVWMRISAGLALAIVAALAAAVWAARVITQRFQHYNAQARALADGSYDLPWIDSNIVEFNQLRDNMRRMAHAVQAREAAMTQAQEELRLSEERLLATINRTPNVAIQWYDSEGRVKMWNHASEIVYGVPTDEALGKTLDQLIYSKEQAEEFRNLLRETCDGHTIGPYESSFMRPDGKRGHLLCTTFAIPGEDEQYHFVCMDIEVTDQKQAEQSLHALNTTLEDRVEERTDELTRANEELVTTLETLQRAQAELLRTEKLAALGSMVAGIAHELNTPIGNGVMAATTLEDHNRSFRRGIESGAIRRSMLDRYLADSQIATDILLRNLQRASDLVKSFKQVAIDQTSAQRRTFRLDEMISEVLLSIQPTLKKSPVSVLTEITPDVWLDSYPGPLGQIITNLIANALIHGFDGRQEGHINIVGRPLDAKRIELSVRDDGCGIAAEHLSKVFDPFFTTRLGKGGSGMGLNIVHTLATRVLGGQIAVSSTVGAGSRFTLDLPRRAPVAAENVLSN